MLVKRTSYIVKRIANHPVYNYKLYWLDSYWLFGIIPIYIKQNGVRYSMTSKG